MKRFAVAFGLLLSICVGIFASNASRDEYWKAPCGAKTTHECFAGALWGPTHHLKWLKVDQELDLARYSHPAVASFSNYQHYAQMGQIPAYVQPAPSGGGYTGPGDIVSGSVYWYGLRGYSAAYAAPGTNCAVDVEDQAGANPLTCVKILSNGNLDVATISAWVTAHSVTTIVVTQAYDQTGNGNHATNGGAVSAHPTLVLNAIGSLPAFAFNGSQALGANTSTNAQPWTVSGSFKVNTGTTGGFAGNFSPNTSIGPSGLASTIQLFAGGACVGSSCEVADTFGTFKVYQGVGNGALSSIKVDAGAPTTLTGVGTSGLGTFVIFGQDTNGTMLTGDILDVGWWASAISPTNQALINTQEHAYWGF